MAQDICGSKMPANDAYGQNGPRNPSSLRPGESAPRSTQFDTKDPVRDAIKAGGSGVLAADPPQSPRSHAITSRGSVPNHPDMRHANDGGAPMGKVR